MTSPLDRLIALSDGEAEAPPIYRLLGISVVAGAAGAVHLQLVTGPGLASPTGRVAGGALATALDTALAWACETMLQVGQDCVTVQLSVNFLASVEVGSGTLDIHATALFTGARMLVANAVVTNAAGHKMAIGTATCLVVTPRRKTA
jgi:uncharacterized protein (TIGR00369 family)